MPSPQKRTEQTRHVEWPRGIETSYRAMTNSLNRIVSILPKPDWIVAGWSVAIKILLFLFAAKSFPALWDKHQTLRELFYNWNRWGAWPFQGIAEVGYSAARGTQALY